VAAFVPPRMNVVTDHHAVEAQFLRLYSEFHELSRSELFRPSLVTDLQVHASPFAVEDEVTSHALRGDFTRL
jgi:hypothetical protein